MPNDCQGVTIFAIMSIVKTRPHIFPMIFDTNIFIYADRGLSSAKQLILDTQGRAISAVTYMEYVNFRRNKQELAFLKNCSKRCNSQFMK